MSTTSSISSQISTMVQQYQSQLDTQYITPLTAKQTTLNTRFTALSTLKTKMQTFYNALQSSTSGTDSSSTVYQVDTSNSSVATATASSSISLGSHTLVVSRVASADTIMSAQYNSSDTTIAGAEMTSDEVTAGSATRQIQVSVGGNVVGTVSITLNAGDTNSSVLQKIRDAINNSSALNTDMSASVISGSAGTARLKITSKTTGSDNAISLADVSGGTLLDNIGLSDSVISNRTATSGTSGGYVYGAASNLDAVFTLDGAEMTRGTNTITDALDGVTLKLSGVPSPSDSQTTTLTVGLNTTNLQSVVNTFITDFNDLSGYVKEQTSVNSDGTANVFSSDQTILNLRINLQSLIFQTVDAAGTDTNSLAKIGITQAQDGTLSISDSTTFSNILENNPEAIANLFGYAGSSSTNGIAVQMKNLIYGFTEVGGQIDSTENIVTGQLNDLKTQISDTNDRITKQVEQYQEQYSKLQTALLQMQEQQQMVSSIMSSVSMG
ncbi:MAG TPA: flagellar filament capping protein FliD [Bacteroidota bacterium]|nr:flagellar filament capping protein FliD [Bacteroidota bacterium]